MCTSGRKNKNKNSSFTFQPINCEKKKLYFSKLHNYTKKKFDIFWNKENMLAGSSINVMLFIEKAIVLVNFEGHVAMYRNFNINLYFKICTQQN